MRNVSFTIQFLLLLAVIAFAGQTLASPQDAPATGLSAADLEEMLGPIALYPDELLANVLAASIYPDELKAAHAFVSGSGDATKIGEQGWESSVQSIAKIPDVLDFLIENMEWTIAIGQAYIVQNEDVMAAVQSLRAKAKKNGSLQNSEQMTVVQDGTTIIIEPADPEVIYVPTYQPSVVYVDSGPSSGDVFAAGVIGFGVGIAIGACFNDDFDCDWHGGCIGWGYGHNDIDIDRDINIETGDINIGSGNTVTGGDRTNVQGGNRNTVKSTGREGSQFQPNSQKVDTQKIKSGGASQLQSFQGASSKSGAAASRVPTKASPSRPSGRTSPAASPTKARSTSAQPAARSSTPKAKSPAPRPKTPAPAARAAPAQSKPSGFSPDRGSAKSSSRGSSSRSASGGSRGGGSRGGGGRRG